MKCQDCQQRQATLHFTKIINGEKTEFHICEQCAREKGEHFPGANTFSIHQLLSGLLHFEQPLKTGQEIPSSNQNLNCEKCGMTYEQFTRVGRFGCANCYKSFDMKLDPLLKRVHSGNHTHTGKIPVRVGGGIQIQRQIDLLKNDLKKHIEQEEFELAADVRDQIRSLEKQKTTKGRDE